jgi:hypothetical protein
MFVASANVRYAVRCVELSQTGLLVSSTKLLREATWPYASALLPLPGGHAKLLLRRVGSRRRNLAYSIVALDDASQSLLTDFLFDSMHQALPRAVRTRRPTRRVA